MSVARIIPMVLPIKFGVKIFGTDSFELNLNWKDSDGNTFDLTTCSGNMYFYTSKSDRTLLKTVTTTGLTTGTRMELSDVSPNIYVRIVDTETQIGSPPDFTDTPGYFVLDISSPDTELTVRLAEGKVTYEL
jgi:hypothetical protein